jgi:hypothetical protein
MVASFINNPFVGLRIGHGKFFKYVSTHLAALQSANNIIAILPLANALALLIAPYKQWLSTQDQNTIDKTGDTDELDVILDAFEDFVTDDLFKDIAYHFAKEPAIIHEAFPNGKSEYHKITRINAPILLQRIADFCVKHKAKLDAGRDVTSKQFLDNYNAQRETQLDSKTTVLHGSDTGTALRDAIADYMFDILLNLLLIHKTEREVVLNYYDESIVSRSTKKAVPPPTAK